MVLLHDLAPVPQAVQAPPAAGVKNPNDKQADTHEAVVLVHA